MIPKKHAELLELPPETKPEEARQRCERLLEMLRQEMNQLPPGHPDWPHLEQRCYELEKALKELSEKPEAEAPEATDAEPPISNFKSEIQETAVPSPRDKECAEASAKADSQQSDGDVPENSDLLSGEFRKTLDLGNDATPDQALERAEARLKEIIDAQGALKPRHPAHPRLKRDREHFEKIVAELREIAFGQRVDDLCDHAEEALASQPANKTKARDFLRRARQEARQLPAESGCLRRLQNLEARLDSASPEPLSAPPSPDAPGAPVPAAPPTRALLPLPEISPVTSTPLPAPENPFLLFETLVDKGTTALTQDMPDTAAALEHFAAAEREAAGKKIPDNLRSRLQLFKRMLDQVRRESIHLHVGVTLQEAATALGQSPPGIAEARAHLARAESLLGTAPDPFLQGEAGRVARAIEEHEQWLAHYQNLQPPAEEFPPQAQNAHPGLVEPPPLPRTLNVSTEAPEPGSEAVPEAEPPAPPRPTKWPRREIALQLGMGLLILGLIGIALAFMRIIKVASTPGEHATNRQTKTVAYTPSLPEAAPERKFPPSTAHPASALGELNISVTPPEAELFTNGVAMGHVAYPLHLRGVRGQQVALEARLEGYSNATMTVEFPSMPSSAELSLELQPKPALLIVRSEPSAPEVSLRDGHSTPQTVTRSDDGIEVAPGMPVEVSLEVPDYETVTTNISPLKPGEHRLVDFGRLQLQTAMLRLKADPSNTQFSVIYLGREPVLYGPSPVIRGIIPRVAFQVVASCPGYASMSNSFLLKPRESAEYDFGRLTPLPASLLVNATPANFNLKVAWDGASMDYGAEHRAAGLPPGKNLVVTVSAEGREPALTNLVLEPGEKRELFFSGLQPAKGFLLLKSDPPGAEVSYGIDGHSPAYAGVIDRIDGLPLGHTVEVTLRKAGFQDRTLTNKLSLASDTLDFGRLMPKSTNSGADTKLVSPVKPAVNPQASRYSASNIEKLLREIDAYTIIVRNNIPLTETSRRDWNEWINKVEAMHRDNGIIWSRLQTPLAQLRDMVNRTVPPQVVPVTASTP